MAHDIELHDTARSLVDELTGILGADHVLDGPEERAFYAHDIFSAGEQKPAVVVAPSSLDELTAVARVAAAAGASLVPRGGGMSYTGGYHATREDVVLLDMRRMDRVLDINPTDMTVTVEAGCTWRSLHQALASHGLRTPFWGPLSGISSTIGGGVAQLNAVFGSGLYGTTSDSVIAVTVVTSDGAVLRTGGRDRPFWRHYGPDLTGLFCGDAGALGVKAEITLRLIPTPEHERWASYEFDDVAAVCAAASDIARANLACEIIGFDPGLARVRMRRASMMADAKTLANVVSHQKSLLGGLKEGAKMVMAGRDFLGEAAYSLHVVVEGRTRAGVDAEFAILDQLAQKRGGRAVENSIPKALRANPFTPLNNILGPDGERWAPVHGIVAHSHAETCWREIDALFASMADEFERHGVTVGYLLSTLATTAFLIEPVFLWPEALEPIHEETVEPAHLAKMTRRPANPEATAVVATARAKVIEVFQRHGGTHFQIGRTYPYLASRDEAGGALLAAVKAALDPNGRMNPGALGLE